MPGFKVKKRFIPVKESNNQFTIRAATVDDVPAVAALVDELLSEIMQVIGVQAFDVASEETAARLRDFIETGRYAVFVAIDGRDGSVGFIAMYESCALYAGGVFGTIPELYVRPEFRSLGIGQGLLEAARKFGKSRGWTRLEVTTPPLPEFDRTLAFYEQEGFAVTGGRKLKALL
ncbi:MAG: GNAT family N-acetyltransferase [Chlorobaculum sp.]|nr:GNAT family N-acetyltransferase [Chlorobaculum sp.]